MFHHPFGFSFGLDQSSICLLSSVCSCSVSYFRNARLCLYVWENAAQYRYLAFPSFVNRFLHCNFVFHLSRSRDQRFHWHLDANVKLVLLEMARDLIGMATDLLGLDVTGVVFSSNLLFSEIKCSIVASNACITGLGLGSAEGI